MSNAAAFSQDDSVGLGVDGFNRKHPCVTPVVCIEIEIGDIDTSNIQVECDEERDFRIA